MSADWVTMMKEHFPMATADARSTLEFFDGRNEDGRLIAVMRLCNFDEYDGQRALRDVKEQEVAFGRLEHFELRDRYAAFLDALASVFGRCDPEQIEISMPYELVCDDVLDLVSVRDTAGFEAALSAKSRLGKMM